MKKFNLSSVSTNEVLGPMKQEWLSDRAKLEKEFGRGKMAYIKYQNGNLVITVGRKPTQRKQA